MLKHAMLIGLFSLFALFVFEAKVGAESVSVAAAPRSELGEPSSLAEQRERRRPPGPPLCQSESHCAEHCPNDAMGCPCVEHPHGDSVCVPICLEDADCPAGHHDLVCDLDASICVPREALVCWVLSA